MERTNVVVLGAGVIGLSNAILLLRKKSYEVTIVAEHMPGDYDISYASPWAGANFLPTGYEDSPQARFEKDTWPHLDQLARDFPEAGIHFQNHSYYYNRDQGKDTALALWKRELEKDDPWYASVVPNFRLLKPSEIPVGYDAGSTFTSVCINTALYLPWLASQALKLGATIRRGVVQHISEAADLHSSGRKADIVVNATGLGARKLGGIEDLTVNAARGQTVLVRNDPGVMFSTSGASDFPDESAYVMHRAAGGGAIIGGCYQKGQWDSQVDVNMANRLMARAVAVCPSLIGPSGVKGLSIAPATPEEVATGKAGAERLSVIKYNVGLRPVRDGGPRVEKEVIQGQCVIHAYGHGGAGYQSSWGTAEATVRLADAASGRV